MPWATYDEDYLTDQDLTNEELIAQDSTVTPTSAQTAEVATSDRVLEDDIIWGAKPDVDVPWSPWGGADEVSSMVGWNSTALGWDRDMERLSDHDFNQTKKEKKNDWKNCNIWRNNDNGNWRKDNNVNWRNDNNGNWRNDNKVNRFNWAVKDRKKVEQLESKVATMSTQMTDMAKQMQAMEAQIQTLLDSNGIQPSNGVVLTSDPSALKHTSNQISQVHQRLGDHEKRTNNEIDQVHQRLNDHERCVNLLQERVLAIGNYLGGVGRLLRKFELTFISKKFYNEHGALKGHHKQQDFEENQHIFEQLCSNLDGDPLVLSQGLWTMVEPGSSS